MVPPPDNQPQVPLLTIADRNILHRINSTSRPLQRNQIELNSPQQPRRRFLSYIFRRYYNTIFYLLLLLLLFNYYLPVIHFIFNPAQCALVPNTCTAHGIRYSYRYSFPVFLDRPFPLIVANSQLPIHRYQYRHKRCRIAVHSRLQTLDRHRTFGWKDVARRWYRHQTTNKCSSSNHCFRFVVVPLLIPIMDNDILDERSREFLETADQYITEHGHQHVSEENSKQLVNDQHNLPEEFRIDENGELSHHATGYYDTNDILSGNGSTTLTEDDHRLANELAAELAQQNKSLVDGGHHDTHLMTSYLYSTDFDLNTNSKHSSQTSSHINNQQIISSENLIEDEASESDYHVEIQNNLPHKKRFRKRESTPAPMRNIHSKCYKCKQCGEQFNSQSAVTAHKPVHAPKKVNGRMPFLCEICDKHFTHQIKFFEHLKFHYEPQQSKVIVVTTDSGTSPHHVNYQNHNVQESTDNNENQYIEETIEDQPELHDLPPLQSYRLTEEENMEDDKHCIFSSDGSILAAQLQQPFPSCHLCGRNFRRLKALEIHMASVHPQPATVVTVKQDCLEEFSDPEDLMEGIRHMVPGVADTESETDEKQPIQEQIWDYNGENMTNHVDPMIKPKEENNCLLSGNDDNGENSRAEHTWEDDTDELEQIMKKNISKNLICTQCKRKFNHRNSLLYHLRSHSGKRPHSCKLCPKSFFSSSALKVHNRLHTGDKPFECEWCGRNFRQWGDLKYHIASLHSESKQFQCEFCGKDFARKYSLIVHRRIHTGEKNYVCEFCKKTFRASSYLQNHRRIHTGEKPYKCETCGKAFRVRSDMRRHTVVHRKDVVNSVQINSYAGQVSGIVTSSDMSIHLTKLEVDKDKITEDSDGDVKFHENFSHDSNQILTADEVSAPLNLNLRAQDNGHNDESANYEQFNGRQEIIDRETNTLYVWIPSNTEQLLQSE